MGNRAMVIYLDLYGDHYTGAYDISSFSILLQQPETAGAPLSTNFQVTSE